jgi:hypothetical protein
VTTIINSTLGWSSGSLIHAAWKLGSKGLDYKKEWNKAASIGSAVHEKIECKINNTAFSNKKYSFTKEEEKYFNTCIDSYRRWEKRYKPTYIACERSLVSEMWQVGGTVDIVASIKKTKDGNDFFPILIDIKTSKGVYDNHIIQLAAYLSIWNELNEERLQEAWIVHLKKTGGYRCHKYDLYDLNPGKDIFSHLAAINSRRSALEEML